MSKFTVPLLAGTDIVECRKVRMTNAYLEPADAEHPDGPWMRTRIAEDHVPLVNPHDGTTLEQYVEEAKQRWTLVEVVDGHDRGPFDDDHPISPAPHIAAHAARSAERE
jgi:hypothetical protein